MAYGMCHRSHGYVVSEAGQQTEEFPSVLAREMQGVEERDRRTLKQIYTDPSKTLTTWLDVEHMIVALGGFAEWTDKRHLVVKLNGHTTSFRTPDDKSGRIDAADGERLRDFLRSAGVNEDTAESDGENN